MNTSKVTGKQRAIIFPDEEFEARYKAQKDKYLKNISDPKKKAKYEQWKTEKYAKIEAEKKQIESEEKAAIEEARQNARREAVRKKAVAELYNMLGIDEEYIARKREEMQQALGAIGEKDRNTLNQKELFEADYKNAMAAVGSTKANIRDDKYRGVKNTSDIASGISATGDMVSKVAGAAGMALPGVMGAALGGLSWITGGISVVSFAICMALMHKKKMRNQVSKVGNAADSGEKISNAEASLKEFQDSVQAMISEIESGLDVLVAEYQQLNKEGRREEFKDVLKKFLSEILERHGFGNMLSESEIEQSVQTEAKVEKIGAQELEEAKKEKTAEMPAKHTPIKKKDVDKELEEVFKEDPSGRELL